MYDENTKNIIVEGNEVIKDTKFYEIDDANSC